MCPGSTCHGARHWQGLVQGPDTPRLSLEAEPAASAGERRMLLLESGGAQLIRRRTRRLSAGQDGCCARRVPQAGDARATDRAGTEGPGRAEGSERERRRPRPRAGQSAAAAGPQAGFTTERVRREGERATTAAASGAGLGGWKAAPLRDATRRIWGEQPGAHNHQPWLWPSPAQLRGEGSSEPWKARRKGLKRSAGSPLEVTRPRGLAREANGIRENVSGAKIEDY